MLDELAGGRRRTNRPLFRRSPAKGNVDFPAIEASPPRFLLPEGFPRLHAPPPLPHRPGDGLSRRNRARLRRLLPDGGGRYRGLEDD
jgi:hypothetical protein